MGKMTDVCSFFFLLPLLALQSLVNLSLFQNCRPLFSVLLLLSPFPHSLFFRSSSID